MRSEPFLLMEGQRVDFVFKDVKSGKRLYFQVLRDFPCYGATEHGIIVEQNETGNIIIVETLDALEQAGFIKKITDRSIE